MDNIEKSGTSFEAVSNTFLTTEAGLVADGALEVLGLSTRAYNVLMQHRVWDISTLYEWKRAGRFEGAGIRNLGRTSRQEIYMKLEEYISTHRVTSGLTGNNGSANNEEPASTGNQIGNLFFTVEVGLVEDGLVSELSFSSRIANTLSWNRIQKISILYEWKKDGRLVGVRNLGKGSRQEISEKLTQYLSAHRVVLGDEDSAYEDLLKEKESVIEELKCKIDSLHKQLIAKQEKIEYLQEQNITIQNRNEALQDSLIEKQKKIEKLQESMLQRVEEATKKVEQKISRAEERPAAPIAPRPTPKISYSYPVAADAVPKIGNPQVGRKDTVGFKGAAGFSMIKDSLYYPFDSLPSLLNQIVLKDRTVSEKIQSGTMGKTADELGKEGLSLLQDRAHTPSYQILKKYLLPDPPKNLRKNLSVQDIDKRNTDGRDFYMLLHAITMRILWGNDYEGKRNAEAVYEYLLNCPDGPFQFKKMSENRFSWVRYYVLSSLQFAYDSGELKRITFENPDVLQKEADCDAHEVEN